ncbi:hypothetical protein [Rhizobium herbae]|uniref:Uncharacterized protein n=1 Tax=Rhizobium herbae TaxID=508661 RepID=A0ABS4EKS9_9HYPH|nr:hypothetical protein [Rhizobium herbae]MBP1858525.1 hypothetical protein [Rhizobium herbae]
MNFEIRIYDGVGPIRFGMTPNEVRTTLGVEFKSFRRTTEETHPCDYFTGLQCFVYYDDTNGRVEAVEFAEPAEPTLIGINMLRLGFADLLRQIKELDPEVIVESDGFTSLSLGVGGWAPSAEEEPTVPCESVIVFVRGYYD